MTKIVYNACFGDFSISDAAIRRYAELKGLTLYPEKDRHGFTTYWTVPESERTGILSESNGEWHNAPMAARAESNRRYTELTLDTREFDRADPILVQVVEELGEAANGECASLFIRELEPGTKYIIHEYNGNESVRTIDEYDWLTA